MDCTLCNRAYASSRVDFDRLKSNLNLQTMKEFSCWKCQAFENIHSAIKKKIALGNIAEIWKLNVFMQMTWTNFDRFIKMNFSNYFEVRILVLKVLFQ